MKNSAGTRLHTGFPQEVSCISVPVRDINLAIRYIGVSSMAGCSDIDCILNAVHMDMTAIHTWM